MMGAKNGTCGELSKSIQIFLLEQTIGRFPAAVRGAPEVSAPTTGVSRFISEFKDRFRKLAGNCVNRQGSQPQLLAPSSGSRHWKPRQRANPSAFVQLVSAAEDRAVDTLEETKFPSPPVLPPGNLPLCTRTAHRLAEGGE